MAVMTIIPVMAILALMATMTVIPISTLMVATSVSFSILDVMAIVAGMNRTTGCLKQNA